VNASRKAVELLANIPDVQSTIVNIMLSENINESIAQQKKTNVRCNKEAADRFIRTHLGIPKDNKRQQ